MAAVEEGTCRKTAPCTHHRGGHEHQSEGKAKKASVPGGAARDGAARPRNKPAGNEKSTVSELLTVVLDIRMHYDVHNMFTIIIIIIEL